MLNQWNNTVMYSNKAVSCQSLKAKQNLVVVNPLQVSLHFTEAPVVFLAGIAISVPSSGNTFTNHVQHVAEFYRKHFSQHIITGIATSAKYLHIQVLFPLQHTLFSIWLLFEKAVWDCAYASLWRLFQGSSASGFPLMCLSFSYKNFHGVELEDLAEWSMISRQQRQCITPIRVTTHISKCCHGACRMNLKYSQSKSLMHASTSYVQTQTSKPFILGKHRHIYGSLLLYHRVVC